MTFLAARLAELRRHLDHLHGIRPGIASVQNLREDLTTHNDVLFSLLMVSQLVADIAGELNSRRGLSFGSYREAVENLTHYDEFEDDLVATLARLPGFRNIVLHEYVRLDYERVLAALSDLGPIERFMEIAARLELEEKD